MRESALSDPRRFLGQFAGGAILEASYVALIAMAAVAAADQLRVFGGVAPYWPLTELNFSMRSFRPKGQALPVAG